MRTKSSLALAVFLLIATFFTSCDKECKEVKRASNEVTFATNINASSLRVTGNNWDNNDAIGVYMMENGQPISTAFAPNNAKYVASTGGSNTTSFTPATEQDKLFWAEGATSADFIAYYPYSATQSGNELSMNTQDQSHFSAIDYLIAVRSSQAKSATSTNVLSFKHVLPLLVFEFKDKSNAPIEETKISGMKIAGLKVTGKLNLEENTVTPEGDATAFQTNGTTALVIPQTSTENVVVSFQFGGKNYTWDLGTKTFEKGKKYIFRAKLSDGSVAVDGANGTIGEREPEDTGGDVDLDPTGSSEPTTLSSDVTTYEFTADAGSHDFVISTDASSISATSDATWAKVPTGKIVVEPTGKATLTITVEANTTNAVRNATITIKHDGVLRTAAAPITLSISQAAQEAVTPTPTPTEGDLIISAYVEGKKSDKYIKISNRTAAPIDLTAYSIRQYNNGKKTVASSFEQKLSGTLDAGKFIVIYHKQASFTSFPNAAQAIVGTGSTINFNGDDAIALAKNNENIDVFGVIGNPNKSMLWADKIYARNSNISTPTTTFQESQWEVEPVKKNDPIQSIPLFSKTFSTL